MRFTLTALVATAALMLAGCGSPAPLVADPAYDPKFGPSVQYHAGRDGQDFVMDGVAQGVPSLEARLRHNGQVVKTQPVDVSNAYFSLRIGPVADGDQVELVGGDYMAAFVMSFPSRVTGGTVRAGRPQAQAELRTASTRRRR